MAAVEQLSKEPLVQGCKALFFGGGIVALVAIPTTLPVFVGPKMLSDPDGFSAGVVLLGQTLIYAGWAVSALLVVPLSDRIGRKPVLYSLLATGLAAVVSAALTSSPLLFVISMFFSGLLGAAGAVGYVLCQETSTGVVRQYASSIVNCLFSIQAIIIAYVCTRLTQNMHWRHEMMGWFVAFYAPMLIIGPFVTEESPRFSPASNNDGDDQEKQSVNVIGVAKERGGEDADKQTQSPVEMLFCKDLLPTTVATCLCWASGILGYYGLNFSAHSFSDDVGLNMMLLATADLISFGAAPVVAGYVGGIRPLQMGSFFLASVAVFFIELFPAGSRCVLIGAMAGRLMIDFACVGIYALITETFPSNCCSSACGIANFCSRSAAMMAPLCGYLPVAEVSQIIGSLLLLSSVATYILPAPENERQSSKADAYGQVKNSEGHDTLLG